MRSSSMGNFAQIPTAPCPSEHAGGGWIAVLSV